MRIQRVFMTLYFPPTREGGRTAVRWGGVLAQTEGTPMTTEAVAETLLEIERTVNTHLARVRMHIETEDE